MALFLEAYEITLKHEGGYDNDPDDVGGETYKGVARDYYPSWPGWAVIDDAKSYPNFPDNLTHDTELNSMIKDFYRANYWDRFWGDQFSNQNIANELFDTAVNMGVSRSVKFLQTALNLLNRNKLNYPDIDEDGVFGHKTMNALNSYLYLDKDIYLLKIMNILQGMHYINYMKSSPNQEKFARGWLKRVTITKS
jgi:lysozyme family protein